MARRGGTMDDMTNGATQMTDPLSYPAAEDQPPARPDMDSLPPDVRAWVEFLEERIFYARKMLDGSHPYDW